MSQAKRSTTQVVLLTKFKSSNIVFEDVESTGGKIKYTAHAGIDSLNFISVL